jgi:hypothetical protein
LSGQASGAKLFKSIYGSNAATQASYDDNGASISVVYASSQFPKTPNINQKQVIESTIEVSAQNNVQLKVSAFDEDGTLLDSQPITSGAPLASIWNAFVWSFGTWGSAIIAPKTITVPWSTPLIFKKMSIKIEATSNNYISLGSFFAKYRDTGYINK